MNTSELNSLIERLQEAADTKVGLGSTRYADASDLLEAINHLRKLAEIDSDVVHDLADAAEDAQEILREAPEGSEQHKRGEALLAALQARSSALFGGAR